MAHLSLRFQWVRDEWIGRLVGVFDDDTPASFIEIQAAICRDKMLVSLRARFHQRTQCSELATDNRLVGGSSLPSPTTQSCAHGDFPVRCESPRTGGDLCTHFVSAICRLDCRERFGVFVSALENCVSRRWRLALVEIWFECRISGTENQAFRGHRDGSAECLLWRRTSPRDRRANTRRS